MGTTIIVGSLQGSRRPRIAYQASRPQGKQTCTAMPMHMHMPCRVKHTILGRSNPAPAPLPPPSTPNTSAVWGFFPLFPIRRKPLPTRIHTQAAGALVSTRVQPAPTERARGQVQPMIACPWNSIRCERRDTRHLRPVTSLSCATRASCEGSRKDSLLRCHGRSVFQRRGLSPLSDSIIKPARGLFAAS